MDDTLRVSSLGFDASDATDALQAALDGEAATVIIDDIGTDWITRPLFLRRSNVRLHIEPGVVVRALPGGYPHPRDSLLTVRDCSGVRISGYGATFAMNKAEYATPQWRMALKLWGVTDAVIEGLTLRDSGGDGVYIGRSPGTPVSSAVVLRDLLCDGNARHGLSAVSVAGLRVEGCAFVRTEGSAPQSGIEFRTNFPEEQLTSILVVDCVCEANVGSGIELVGGGLTTRSTPLSVRVVRSTIGVQGNGGPQVLFGPSDSDTFAGSFEIETSVFHTEPAASAVEVISREPSGPRTRTVHWDSGVAPATRQPILLLSRGDVVSGNLTLTNCVLVPGDRPLGGGEMELRASASAVRGGQPVILTFSRSGADRDDLSQPVAATWSRAGSARERYDYGGLTGAVVIPAGQRETSLTVRTLPRHRPDGPRIRTVVFNLDNPSGDSTGSVAVQIHG